MLAHGQVMQPSQQMGPQSMVSVQMPAQAMMSLQGSSAQAVPLLLPAQQCHIVPSQGRLPSTSSPRDCSHVCRGYDCLRLTIVLAIRHLQHHHHFCDYYCFHLQALAWRFCCTHCNWIRTACPPCWGSLGYYGKCLFSTCSAEEN